MDFRKLLYAGLIAASMCCERRDEPLGQQEFRKAQEQIKKERELEARQLQQERQDGQRKLCEVTYKTTITIATALTAALPGSSEGVRERLSSKGWCEISDRYESDRHELTLVATELAKIYCLTVRDDLLFSADGKSFNRTEIYKTFPCEGSYNDLIHQSFSLQRIINSYQKK